MMNILIITGGAESIGENFVHTMLDKTDVRDVIVDKLNDDGHRESSEDLEASSRLQFN